MNIQERYRDQLTRIPNRTNNSLVPNLELSKSPIVENNYLNLLKLFDKQEETSEGCFFVGLYGLSAALYPNKQLPDANEFWNGIESQYSHILEKGKLVVKHEKIECVLDIFRQWNIIPTKITVNNQGEQIIGRYLKDKKIIKHFIPKTASLNTDEIISPFSILLHQAGGNNTHYITIDGTEYAELQVQKYFQDYYNTIAVFDFEIMNPENTNGSGAEGVLNDGNVVLRRAV